MTLTFALTSFRPNWVSFAQLFSSSHRLEYLCFSYLIIIVIRFQFGISTQITYSLSPLECIRPKTKPSCLCLSFESVPTFRLHKAHYQNVISSAFFTLPFVCPQNEKVKTHLALSQPSYCKDIMYDSESTIKQCNCGIKQQQTQET